MDEQPDVAGFDSAAAAVAALNTVGHFVGLLTPDGILIEANAAALAAGGLRRIDVVGRPFWEAHWWSYDTDVIAELRAAIRRAAAGDVVSYRVSVRAADAGASLVEIDFRLTPLYSSDGEVEFLVPEGSPVAGDAPSSESWARLVAEAGEARDEADRLRRLASELSRVHSVEDVVEIVHRDLPALLGAAMCNVAVSVDGDRVRLWNPSSLPGDVRQRWADVAMATPTPLTDAIRLGTDVWVRTEDELAERYPGMLDDARASGLSELGASVVRDRFGEPQAAIGIGYRPGERADVAATEPVLALAGAALKRALATQRSERDAALLDVLIQRAPVGMVFLDSDLRFAIVNQHLAEINGIPVEAHLGRTVTEVVPDLAPAATPLLRQVLDTGEPIVDVLLTGTTPATGDRLRTWQESFYPVEARDGTVVGVGAIVSDITDRLEHQQRLIDLAERLRLALQISSAGWFEWDPTTGAFVCSRELEELYGVGPDHIAGLEQLLAFCEPADRPHVEESLRKSVEAIDDRECEFGIRDGQGRFRWVQAITRPIPTRSGGVERLIGVHIDVTERKQRELDVQSLLERQRRLAERLQRAMLPDVPSEIDGWQIAARYLPGTAGLRVGGDWYDVVVHADDDVAIVVGDVVGHDLEAAITMAQLRHAAVAFTHVTAEPDGVLAGLDNLAARSAEALGATVFYARLDPRTGVLRHARAGHQPALIKRSDGSVEVLELSADPPIGVPGRRTTHTTILAPGDCLVAFTDGLVEHRRQPSDTGRDRLAALLVSSDDTDADPLADAIIDTLITPANHDDTALLVVRRLAPPD